MTTDQHIIETYRKYESFLSNFVPGKFDPEDVTALIDQTAADCGVDTETVRSVVARHIVGGE